MQQIEIIQSRQNALVKTCVKLVESRRERLKQARTLLDGTHLIAAALDAKLPPERLLVAASAAVKPEVAALLQRFVGPHSVLDDAVFAAITELDSASGILGLWPIPSSAAPVERGLILALDAVQDPGNVGSILRTAVAAGVEQVWLGMGCADVWSPKVLRAGMGAHFQLPVIERVELLEQLPRFRGKKIITSLERSVALFDADLRGDMVLVLGSEGQGVAPELVDMADVRLHIPMHPGIESLNVGAAAAICLYESARQRWVAR